MALLFKYIRLTFTIPFHAMTLRVVAATKIK